MSRKKSKKNSTNRLSISIIIFLLLVIIAILIILNKGKVGTYSLVKIQSLSVSGDDGSQPDNAPKDMMEISVKKKYLSVKNKETEKLEIMINGEEIDVDEVEIESSNEDVIKVVDGTVKAVSVGKSTITAKKGELTATTDIRAIIPIKSIQFSTTSSTVRVGKVLQMKLIASPSDASIESLKYESSDEKIATVNSNGIVTGISPGNVTITVKDSYSGLEKSVNLSIKK